MSTSDDFERDVADCGQADYLYSGLKTDREAAQKNVIDVPPSLPPIHPQQPPLLSQSRYAIGLEAPAQAEPTGAVWQSQVALGIMLMLVLLGFLVTALSGEWITFWIAMPFAGLVLSAGWRSYQAELAVSRKKKARQAKRRRDMNG
ncbi:MAG: hypothetical protein AAF716_12495 [Cyanobacteria bacterium P01_D01_bin.1]